MSILVNGRFRSHKITGIQRYAHELTGRLGLPVLEPRDQLRGWRGHLWEQTSLRDRARGSMLWSPSGAGPLGLKRQVVTFHDIFPIDFAAGYSRSYAAWYKLMMSLLARTACHLIAVSNYTKQRLVQRFRIDPDKITVIHNGIDPKFYRDGFNKSSEAAPLNLPSTSYLLCVGSVEPRKNVKRLLQAWRSVSAELPHDMWMIITGSRDIIYRQLDIEDDLPRVHFTGYVDEPQLLRLYAGARGFVYPSLGEGFGLPPLEAMAAGVPVLTSGVTSLPEICGSAALYFDPTNTVEMAAKIKTLLTDDSVRLPLATNGPPWAKRYTWERAASKTLDVLQTAAYSYETAPTIV